MNKTTLLIIVFTVLVFQSNLTIAQNRSTFIYSGQTLNEDSIEKEMFKELRKYDLHKDNKDSAWINDFNGHTLWDSRIHSKEGKTETITYSITINYFELDTTHTIITAFSKSNQIIWNTNPRQASSLPNYRHKNPTIRYFQIGELGRNLYGSINKKGERVLFISYSNSQFGFLDLKTGTFTYEGQD